jgi:hypothetical protein
MNITPTNNTVNWFRELSTLGLINYSPDFQRRYVWSEKQKVYLIDTLLNDFSVPKIYVRQILDPESNVNKYEIIDGQQRLTTIINFIDNLFPLTKNKHPKPEYFDSKLEGKYFKDLEIIHKQKIINFSMSIDLVQGEKNEIIEMFLRLNLSNTTLNPQEILNSQYFGDFSQLVGRISNDLVDDFVEDKILPASSIKRMGDHHFVATCLVAQLHGITDKGKKIEKTYNDYDEWNIDEIEKNNSEFKKVYYLITRNIFGGELNSSRYKSNNGFYSLFEYFHDKIFKQCMPLQSDNYLSVKDTLNWMAKEIKMDGVGVGKEWYDLTQQGADTSNARYQRKKILEKLLDVYFNNVDPKRNFTDEERIIAWQSSSRICSICNQTIVSVSDYDLDHIIPHNKGGKTTLSNAQVTHASCNRSKGKSVIM